MTIFPEDKETETEIRGLCAAEVEERIRQGKDNSCGCGYGSDDRRDHTLEHIYLL